MRRSVLFPLLAGTSILAAACSPGDQQPDPMGPTTAVPVPDKQAEIGLRCRDNGLIVLQLAAILSARPPARLYQQAVVKFALVEVALLTRKRELAQSRALELIDFLIDNRGNLINPTSALTATRLSNVIDAILCIVGLPPAGANLGPNTGIGVVPANNPDPVIITTPQGTAGLLVPENFAPDEDVDGNPIPGVVVTVTGNLTTPLNTPLDQYGQTVDLTASQEVEWREGGVTVAICVTVDEFLFDRLRVGHEGGLGPFFGAIEILPNADGDDVTAVVGTCSSGLGFRSGLGGLRSLAERMLLPQPLHAAVLLDKTGGVGGTTKRFSKFRAVDPELELVPRPTSTSGTAGAPVTTPPSVLVRTQTELTPIADIDVKFEVPDGSPGEVSPEEVTTDDDGIAATDSWVLGLGENTVIATPQAPIPAITFTPASTTFTAEGTENAIEYGSGGYQYITIGANAPSAGTTDYPAGQWFLPSFTPTAAWDPGTAPFGQDAANCSVYDSETTDVATPWAAAAGSQANPNTGSGLLVRRTFTTPVGFNGTVVIRVAVDNDIQVYVDGTDVTLLDFDGDTNDDAVDGSWNPTPINGFQAHNGCAQRDDGTFEVPSSVLTEAETTHLIAVFAHDWGGASYFDIEVDLVPFD